MALVMKENLFARNTVWRFKSAVQLKMQVIGPTAGSVAQRP
jgi:hypothetical protein